MRINSLEIHQYIFPWHSNIYILEYSITTIRIDESYAATLKRSLFGSAWSSFQLLDSSEVSAPENRWSVFNVVTPELLSHE